MDFTISVDAKAILQKLKGFDIHKILKEELHKGGDLILKDAKEKVHVVSGDLKASGTVDKGERDVTVRFTKDYAKIEENRTGGKRGGSHAYLGPSADKNIPIIVKNMDRAVKESLQ
jgi:hypothetical protein